MKNLEFYYPVFVIAATWFYVAYLNILYHPSIKEAQGHSTLQRDLYTQVLVNQLSQLVLFWLTYTENSQPSFFSLGVKWVLAMLWTDVWQFTLHWLFHNVTILYSIHAVHHEVVKPYPATAFYNSFVEGFFMDACGFGIMQYLLTFSSLEGACFAFFASTKTIHDHLSLASHPTTSFDFLLAEEWRKVSHPKLLLCLFLDPWLLWSVVSPNTTLYHAKHHDKSDRKMNLQQPFFAFLDDWLLKA